MLCQRTGSLGADHSVEEESLPPSPTQDSQFSRTNSCSREGSTDVMDEETREAMGNSSPALVTSAMVLAGVIKTGGSIVAAAAVPVSAVPVVCGTVAVLGLAFIAYKTVKLFTAETAHSMEKYDHPRWKE